MSEITRSRFSELSNERKFGFPLKLSCEFPLLPCKIEGITEIDIQKVNLSPLDWEANKEMLPNLTKMSFVQCTSSDSVEFKGKVQNLFIHCATSERCICKQLQIKAKKVHYVLGYHCLPTFHPKTKSLFLETVESLPFWKIDAIIDLLNGIPHLKKLSLINIRIHPTWINRILRACPHLTHLSVCLLPCEMDEIVPMLQETHQLFRRHTRLVSLHIQGQNDDASRRLVTAILRALHLRPTPFRRLSLRDIKYDTNLIIQLCSLFQKGLYSFHMFNTIFRCYPIHRQWYQKFFDLLRKNVRQLQTENVALSD